MNKKGIMKKAVELAKKMQGDWIARMALALKTVWKVVKAMSNKLFPALKGTEKQVAWANDIREKVVQVVEDSVQKFIAKLENAEVFAKKDGAYRAAKKEELEKAFNEFTSNEQASFWIGFAQTNAFHKGQVVDAKLLSILFAEKYLKLRLKDAFIKFV
jgi:hypothetical protein